MSDDTEIDPAAKEALSMIRAEINNRAVLWRKRHKPGRMRRAEIGHHHHVAGPYLLRFAQEASWREDNRRMSNAEQVGRIAGLAMVAKRSVDFCGYWQRHIQ